jgi:CRISPR-associated protein Cmr4
VTCPLALECLLRDAELAGYKCAFKLPQLAELLTENKAIVAPGSACLLPQDQLVFEEFQFGRVGDPAAEEQAGTIANWIASNLLPDRAAYQPTRARFARHFAILTDDDFGHFVRHATEVSGGAPFYQEILPPDTILYAAVLANPPTDATKLLDDLIGYLHHDPARVPILRIGGGETTGKGYCACRLAHGREGSAP